jgi:phosphoribosylamine--glycine ligase
VRVLCIDTDNAGLDFLMRCQAHGHQVKWWNKPKNEVGKGLVERIEDYDEIWSKWMDWADLVYLTGNDLYLDKLEPYRRIGYPIYGTNAAAAAWELDRAEGQRVMKKAGLPIIPGREFHDYDAAIAYVKKEGRAMVSKPSGDADKALSYVSDNPADMVYMLAKWQSDEKHRSDAAKHGFLMQEKKSGCEMGVSGWFGPGGWAGYWEENFEFKKLMNGDLGVNTGEQGTLLRFVKESLLAKKLLKPLSAALREIDYCGCVSVNSIIDDEGTPWPLEFTMREGWPAAHNHMALHEGDPAQWMADLVSGHDTRKVRFDEACISVVVSIPDYPYSHLTSKETCGIPIYLNGAASKDVHLSQCMVAEVPCPVAGKVIDMPCYVTAGDYVLIVTGCGETITGARRSAYTTLGKLRIPGNAGWRTDIGRGKLVERLPQVQKRGYARGLSY